MEGKEHMVTLSKLKSGIGSLHDLSDPSAFLLLIHLDKISELEDSEYILLTTPCYLIKTNL